MKKIYSVGALLCCVTLSAAAQKQGDKLPYNKTYLDSLFRQFSTPRPLTNADAPHPGAIILNKTSRGVIYNMPQDNMAVLVPDMQQVERMPGSSIYFKPAPAGKMPNPLYPQNKPLRIH